MLAVEFEVSFVSAAAFDDWRIEVRNAMEYRRRTGRWWRDLGLWVWRSDDGRVRGIVRLGGVTDGEFLAAFGRRWPMTLRAFAPAALAAEIFAAVRPGVIADVSHQRARYQNLKLSIGPRRPAPSRAASRPAVKPVPRLIEPMPFLI